MQRHLRSSLLFLFALFSLVACGGGGGGGTTPPQGGGNIDNVVVDPQAYYIDAVDGNDANNGKTPQSAWKTLSKLNAITINAGNKILFRTGQRWQGSLEIKNSGTTENPIVIGSYGEGTKPVISAVGTIVTRERNNNQEIEDEEWIPYTSVGGEALGEQYKDPVSDPAKVWYFYSSKLEAHPQRIRINGQEVLGAYYGGELSDKYKWHYNVEKGGQVFYWYGNDKPNSFEANLHAAPIYIHDAQHVKVENIALEGGYVAGVFIENSSDVTVTGCTTGAMSKQGVYVKATDGSPASGIVVTNNTIDSHYTFDYSDTTGPDVTDQNGFVRTPTTRGAQEGVMFWGAVQNSTISGNTIKNWTHANINMSADNAEQMTNNRVSGNELLAPDIAYGGRLAIDGKNAANNEVDHNTIHDIRSPIQFNGHDNSLHDNDIYNIFESPLKPDETGDAIILQAYSGPVYNNRIIDNRFRNIAKQPIRIIGVDVTNIITEPNTIE